MKERGLTSQEAKSRLEKFGYNELEDPFKISPVKILLRQIKNNFVIYLLSVAAFLSFFVGKSFTGYVIIAVIIIVISTGFIQEFRAERSIESLKKILTPLSIVIRDGREKEVPTKELVPGDIVILRTGERVPADCNIISETDLYLDESILTGESEEVRKDLSDDLKSKIFMGSYLVRGKCTAKITSTGMETKFGKIASLISSIEKDLPLQHKVNRIAKYTAVVGIIMAGLTSIIVLMGAPITNEAIIAVLVLAIAIAVSAFPEAFPVVLTTTLSAGAYRMARKNAIVNRMSVIETLGETTVICSDKTGTITKGEMTVKKIFTDNKEIEVSGVGYHKKGEFKIDSKTVNLENEKSLNILLKSGVLCNDSQINLVEDELYHVIGNPTEASLLVMAAKAGMSKPDTQRMRELPFSSERKFMATSYNEDGQENVYVKGALEVVLDKCKYIQRDSGVFRLLNKDKEFILNENRKMTSRAFRTIGMAYKTCQRNDKSPMDENLIFTGFVSIEDPPRDEIKDSLILCKEAGIKVKMITGDNKETAISIARQINLDVDNIIEGYQLDKISDSELERIVERISIFARVRPEHKLRIVKALKKNGEVVTMTGDGVNDAPALKEAHIGVAMGKNGTDVSRSVSDITLKDDNFATIVDAIKEGRMIFNNIRKFISYQLSCNASELTLIFIGVLLAPFFGWGIPILLAIHVLFMNLVTSDIPAITLGLNPSSKDIMTEKPRRNARILNKGVITFILFAGIAMAILTLSVYYLTFNVMGQTMEEARSSTLVALIMLEIAGAFSFRSFRKPTFGRSMFTNRYLVYASIISIILTILAIYTPLSKVLETVAIPLFDWGVIIILCLVFVLIFDLFKKIVSEKELMREI